MSTESKATTLNDAKDSLLIETEETTIKNNVLIDERANRESYRRGEELHSVGRLYKNLIIVSISFLLLFTAFLSLQNLQSSLNIDQGLGPIGLTIVYVALILSSLFLPSLCFTKLGMKWTMVLSMMTYLGYLAASFHAVWATIIPTSVALGLGAGTMWAGKMMYVNELSRRFSTITAKNISYAKDRFFGIFFAIYHTADVWGNLASSLVFSMRGRQNRTEQNSSCGISFCPKEEAGNTNLLITDKTKIYIYSGFCVGCAILAVLLMVLFLDNIREPQERKSSAFKLLTMGIRHFIESWYQKLLVPVTIYRGYAMGFIVSDFSAAFTSCTLGVENVGFTMICFGVGCSISAFVFGRVTRWTGYIVPFTIGFIFHAVIGILLLIWVPSRDVPFVFYICVAGWGLGYSVYSSLLSAVYSNLFLKNIDAAISCFRVLDSVGWALAFGFSSFLCTSVKLASVLGLLVVSTVLLLIVLVHHKRTQDT